MVLKDTKELLDIKERRLLFKHYNSLLDISSYSRENAANMCHMEQRYVAIILLQPIKFI